MMLNQIDSIDDSKLIKVWDPLVRFFHWSLVLLFFIAFITEDDFLRIHSFAGYIILSLVCFRILWGFIGSRYARFSNFIYSLKNIKQFVKEILLFKAKRYIGHNPAGGAMIILLMSSLLICTITGMAVYGVEQQAGPMASWFTQHTRFLANVFEEIHEFFANFIMFLIVIHVFGVIFESVIHKENLVKSMITGWKSA
ncbi:MAG: cytochrome b/b6 domain-containing protein [Pseudomonadota bacterium]